MSGLFEKAFDPLGVTKKVVGKFSGDSGGGGKKDNRPMRASILGSERQSTAFGAAQPERPKTMLG